MRLPFEARVDFDSTHKLWCVVTGEPGIEYRTYFYDDPVNEDGSKPEGWRSGEEKATEEATGTRRGCC